MPHESIPQNERPVERLMRGIGIPGQIGGVAVATALGSEVINQFVVESQALHTANKFAISLGMLTLVVQLFRGARATL